MEQTLIVTSPNFPPYGKIPEEYTCEGGNVNPEIRISNIPPETKSFAVVVDDADAIGPEGPFVHWLIWNMDPKTTTIWENTVPPGAVEGLNSAGQTGWTGPCPPPLSPEPHDYRFMVFALDQMLQLSEGSSKYELQKAMEGKIIGTGELVGQFSFIPTKLQT